MWPKKRREVFHVRYLEFSIERYRSIDDPITINIDKHPFLPIVGLNESGKTTILEAIFAVDHANDGE